MTLAAGAAGVSMWFAVPSTLTSGPGKITLVVAIPAFWILPPILAAGALIGLYRSITWRAPAAELPQPLGSRSLKRGIVVSITVFPVAFLATAFLYGIAEASFDIGDLFEPAAGFFIAALVMITARWACSRLWVKRAAAVKE